MTGHKKEIRPGVWRLRVSMGLDPVTGKYRYTSKTVVGGPRIADKALAELSAGISTAKSSVTLGRLLEEYISTNRGLALKTRQSYDYLASHHIVPALGKKKIEALTGRDLDNFYKSLADKGLSAKTINHMHSLIRVALNQAIKWGWIEKNVATLATPPTVRASVASAPSPHELGLILTEAAKHNQHLAAMLTLSALTGARRGEALAIRHSDYDPKERTLTISRSIGYTVKDGTYEKSTKTNGRRKIGLDDTLESVILSQMQALTDDAKYGGFEIVQDPFLFYAEPDGSKPFHPDSPSKFFRKICDSLGMDYHLHQLRHFTATQLIAAGVDVRTVSGRLGHADASITLRIYSHVLEAQDRAASEYLGSIVSPQKTPELKE